MARYRLREGEVSSVYSPGQFVSAAYARRYPHKVKRVRISKPKVAPKPKPKPRIKPKPPKPPEIRVPVIPPREWEVTGVLRTRKKKKDMMVDITFRIRPRLGIQATAESVKKAVWASVVHGRRLLDYEIQGIDWRNRVAGRGEQVYEYRGDRIGDAAVHSRSVLRRLGMEALRVAPVKN